MKVNDKPVLFCHLNTGEGAAKHSQVREILNDFSLH